MVMAEEKGGEKKLEGRDNCRKRESKWERGRKCVCVGNRTVEHIAQGTRLLLQLQMAGRCFQQIYVAL